MNLYRQIGYRRNFMDKRKVIIDTDPGITMRGLDDGLVGR